MANPRKFSEKIALHNQKQAEETAAFEQIMKEVIGATRGPQNNHLSINQSLGAYRAGSLPNVNQMSTNNSIDLQCIYQDYEAKPVNTCMYMPNWSALNSLEDMKQGRDASADRIYRERGRHAVPHQSRRHAFENKRIDVSPYKSSYLSPPPDTNWRRTNSDSALHQSAMSPHENNGSPANRPFGMEGDMQDHHQLNSYWDPKKHLAPVIQQNRPKSCEVPGINIYPTQEDPGSFHVPISNNTGSLPDLTNLHFPPPLTTPLDVEDTSGLTSQSSTSPSSAVTLSPSSLQSQARISGSSLSGGNLVTSAGGSRHSSPGPSPSSRRRHHHNLTNLVIGSSGSPRHQGLTMDANALSLETYPQQFGVYPQQQPNSPPMQQIGSYRSASPADHSCSAPTSPVSNSLSPSSSPGLGNQSYAGSDSSYYCAQQQQLQQQLEQFKMVGDLQLCECFFMMADNCSNSNNSIGSHNNSAMFLATVDSGGGAGPPSDRDFSVLGQSALQFSGQMSPAHDMDSAMMYSISNPQLHSPTLYSKRTATPQTPTSIPDIILTAPSGDEPLLRQDFAKDLGNAISNMCGSLESDFFSEDAIRAGLGPLDFDNLQILTDPEMPIVSDPSAEDTYHVEGS